MEFDLSKVPLPGRDVIEGQSLIHGKPLPPGLREKERRKLKTVWVDKNGRRHIVAKMSNAYIINAMRLLERLRLQLIAELYHAQGHYGTDPFDPAPDGAYDALQVEIAALEDASVGEIWPVYDCMLETLIARGVQYVPNEVQ